MTRLIVIAAALIILAGTGYGYREFFSPGTPVDVAVVSTGEVRTWIELRAGQVIA